MSSISKGGRGRKAPYTTVMVRCPEPLKPIIEQLTANYREILDYKNNEVENEVIKESIIHTFEEYFINKAASPDIEQLILIAANQFIEQQSKEFGKNSSQKGKVFSLDSRSWDNFKKFVSWVKENF